MEERIIHSIKESNGDLDLLKSVYELLQTKIISSKLTNQPVLYQDTSYLVVCAEKCLEHTHLDLAFKCIQTYFNETEAEDEITCKAYMALSSAEYKNSNDKIGHFEIIFDYLQKAMKIALHSNKLYHIVYNCSILYWNFIKALLHYRKNFIPSLSFVVKSLQDTRDKNYSWRCDLSLLLIQSYLDATMTAEASKLSGELFQFIKKFCPDKMENLLSIAFLNQLFDKPETKQGNIMISLLAKAKIMLKNNDKSFENIIEKIYSQISKTSRSKIPFNVLHDTTALCIKGGLFQYGDKFIEMFVPEKSQIEHKFMIDCLKVQLEAQKLLCLEDFYTSAIIKEYLLNLQNSDEILAEAHRTGLEMIVEIAAQTSWNLCLPLLQPNLRKTIRRSLELTSTMLEKHNSPNITTRCMIHIELAKIEDDFEKITSTIQNLEKARDLDHDGQFKEIIDSYIWRQTLQTNLYDKIENSEDEATMLIEQSVLCKTDPRALFIRCGELLAPREFIIAVEGFYLSSQNNCSNPEEKLYNFFQRVTKYECAIKTVENTPFQNIQIWSDFAKEARRREIWDVCLAACYFCLKYENPQNETFELIKNANSLILAQINFICGESLLQLMAAEGLRVGDEPQLPKDESHHSQNYTFVDYSVDSRWISYNDWIKTIHEKAIQCFLSGMKYGEILNENWVVVNGAVYLYNHLKHFLIENKHEKIHDYLRTCWDIISLIKDEPRILQIGEALMKAMFQQVEKVPQTKQNTAANSPENNQFLQNIVKISDTLFSYLFTASENKISLTILEEIIHYRFKAKQLLQQQSGLEMFEEIANLSFIQNLIKTISMIEILSLNKNKIYEFKDANLSKAKQYLSSFSIGDRGFLSHLWAKLCILAYDAGKYVDCIYFSDKIVELGTSQEILQNLSIGYLYKGLSYEKTCNSNVTNSKKSTKDMSIGTIFECYLEASRLGEKAGNYFSVINAAYCFTKVGENFFNGSIGDEVMIQRLEKILDNITHVIRVVEKLVTDSQKMGITERCELFLKQNFPPNRLKNVISKKSVEVNDFFTSNDQNLQAKLYGILFENYMGKQDWSLCLKEMDKAFQHMRKSKYLTAAYHNRIITKAHLELDCTFDIQKFYDLGESRVAHLWRKVALISNLPVTQISSYQKAISCLKDPQNLLQKFSYLLEFSNYFASKNQMENAFDILNYTFDLLLTGKIEDDQETTPVPVVKKERKSKSSNIEKANKKTTKNSDDSSPFIALDTTFEHINFTNTNFNESKLSNIIYLDALLRVHVTFCLYLSFNTKEWAQHCILSYKCICKIIQVHLLNSLSMLKIEEQSAKNRKSKTTEGNNKEKIKKNLTKIPENTNDWINYEIPVEILENLSPNTSAIQIISPEIISNGLGTFLILEKYCSMLFQTGLYDFIMPCVVLMNAIARKLIPFKCFTVLTKIRGAELCSQLKHQDGYNSHINCVINNDLSSDLMLFKINHRQLKKKMIKYSPNKWTLNSNTSYTAVDTIIKMAQFFCDIGKIQEAQDLVDMAEDNSNLFKCSELTLKIERARAFIAYYKQDYNEALAAIKRTTKFTEDVESYKKATHLILNIYTKEMKEEHLEKIISIIDVLIENVESINHSEREKIGLILQLQILKIKITNEHKNFEIIAEKGIDLIILNFFEEGLAAINFWKNFCKKQLNNVVNDENVNIYKKLILFYKKLTNMFNDLRTKIDENFSPEVIKNCTVDFLKVKIDIEYSYLLVDFFAFLSNLTKYEQMDISTARSFCKSGVDVTGTIFKDNEWNNIYKTSLETSLSLARSALKTGIDRGRSLYIIARCLLFSYTQQLPNKMDPWSQEEFNNENDFSHNLTKIGKAVWLLREGTEIMFKSLNLLLKENQDILQICFDFIDILGQLEPSITAQLLSLCQSSKASLWMEKVLLETNIGGKNSKLGYLLHARQILSNNEFGGSKLNRTFELIKVDEALMEFKAWQRTRISQNFFDQFKDYGNNMNFVILQHSHNFLYGASILKSAGKGKLICNVTRIKTDKMKKSELTKANKKYIKHVDDSVYVFEHKMAVTENTNDIETLKTQFQEEMKQLTSRLDSEFDHLCSLMKEYLKPFLVLLKNGENKSVENESVVFFVDKTLIYMPFDVCFDLSEISMAAYDFSQQLYHYRYKREEKTQQQINEKRKQDMLRPPRISNVKETSKKQEKIASLNRQIPPNCEKVDCMRIRFAVDPRNEFRANGYEDFCPSDIFKKIIKDYENFLTPRWLGLSGIDHVVSPGELEVYLADSKSFIFYGFEQICNYLSAATISANNLEECRICMLFDKMRTTRENMIKDNNYLKTALIFSLAGVDCVLTTSHSSIYTENSSRLYSFLNDMLGGGVTTGQACLLQRYGDKRPPNAVREILRGRNSGRKKKGVETVEQNIVDFDSLVTPVEEFGRYAVSNLKCLGLPNLIISQ